LGLLLLDSIDEPHRSIAGDYDVLYGSVFAAAGAELVLHDGRGPLPAHDECEGWIIPGSRESVYDDIAWIPPLLEWTAEAVRTGVSIAGVCFGHQVVAAALGVEVAKADLGWNIGAIDYEVVHQPGWLTEPLPSRYRLIASHQDQIRELPDGAELVAVSERCPLAAYTIGDHVLCMQGHPEFVPELAASLYRYRAEIGRIPAAEVDAAVATLDRPLDRVAAARWLTATARTAAAP
jgi:GMP synthase-like glutamine amidotransferase